MNLYSTLVSLHVLTAILGLGPLTALAFAASSPSPGWSLAWFERLLRLVGWALGLMLVTGMLLIAQTHGALGRTGWMRVAVGLFLLLGALQGVVRRRVRRSRAATPDGGLPAGLAPLLWTMCGLVAAITYLMEAKPW
jgi:hypothetical protein